MGNCRKSKFKHFLYNLNKVRPKSGDKVEKAIDRYLMLLKKGAAQGETNWLKSTMPRALAKIKKYGISEAMISVVATRRGIENLLK